MRAVRIHQAGPHASIQDMGRPGYQWLGVPEGGALDCDAMRLGNALVGNPVNAAGIEICMGGLNLELLAPARLALTGTSDGVLSVQDASGHTLPVAANRSVDLEAGRVVMVGAIPDSNTAILTISGGVETPLFYGSRSTSATAGIGGLDGRMLRDGDVLPLGKPELVPGEAEWMAEPALAGAPDILRCVAGPQDDRFTSAAMETFFSSGYAVTPMLSRMGMRLEGPELDHVTDADIPSDGIVTGSIQVPGNGMPIILLADHQSTGGYTKIATVVSADLPKLARFRPGDRLQFEPVTVTEAEAIARAHRKELLRRMESRQAAPPVIDLGALYGLGDTT